jgi:hypothetical protein
MRCTELHETHKQVLQNYTCVTPEHVVQNYMKHTNRFYRILLSDKGYIEVAIDFKDIRIRGAILPFLHTYSSFS